MINEYELLFISKQFLELTPKRYNLLTQNFHLGEISIMEITDAHRETLNSLQTYYEKNTTSTGFILSTSQPVSLRFYRL